MRSIFFYLLCLFTVLSCSTPSPSTSEPELRIAEISNSLGMTHNSHLNRGFSTPESAYSATFTLEIYLTEETDHTLIHTFAIIDDENEGWVFDRNDIQEAYYEEHHSLIFYNLPLRIFDFINGKQLSAQFIDENDEIIRSRGFRLDNDFPLPASSNVVSIDDGGLSFQLEFYNTPYDGGNIPFPVTIYNTFFASNLVSIVWLDSNNNFISEHFIDTNAFTDLGSDNYLLRIEASSIPVNATKIYSIFRRGWFTSGAALYTEIISFTAEN